VVLDEVQRLHAVAALHALDPLAFRHRAHAQAARVQLADDLARVAGGL